MRGMKSQDVKGNLYNARIVHHMQDICVQSLKPGNRGKVDQHAFLAAVSFTYLLTNERGIKCCSVDISSEQSNIMLTPLNWRTRHGAELVLPKEYWKNTTSLQN